MFRPDGTKIYPEGDWISDWYRGMLFSRFGRPAIRVLADMLRTVQSGDRHAATQAHNFSERVRKELTWDVSAARATRMLLEAQLK